jgi:glyoxylase-like metal-dependent hydrolase (beta-lactamase superfamily II)
MELYKNVYQIQSLFGDRNLFQYLFLGHKTVLVDSGIAETPEKVIFPYLDRLKLRPDSINLVVTTHPDLDHQGGNAALMGAAPNAWLACGAADRAMVEDPRTLFDQRYNYLMAEHNLGLDSNPWPEAGQARMVDVTFGGGEAIGLDNDWSLEVLHVPGHSHGHLALYDRANKAAFVSDAIHGRGCPKAAGGMGIPVTYYYVDIYLSTLRYFETLAIDILYSGHWPVMRGEAIRDFIAESRQTVELFDRVILSNLEKNSNGLTLKELIDAVANAVGDWPQTSWGLAMFPVKGHMDRLEEQGKVRRLEASRPVKWLLR